MSEIEETKEGKTSNNQILIRYFIVVMLLIPVAIGIVVLTCRIAFTEKEKWAKVAESQKKPNRLIHPSRGNIYSSDGKLMATSMPRYYIYMDFRADGFPKDSFLYSKNNGVDSLAFYLSKKFKNRSAASYKNHLMRGLNSKNRKYPVYEGRVSYADLKEVKKFPFIRYGRNRSGFYEKEMIQRQKLFGTLASRTIGDIYNEIETGGLSKGKNGLELQYDSLLRGQAGLSLVMRVGGRWTNVIEEEPVNGMDIVTTIDIPIQDITDKALVDKLKEIDAESGTAIVMEVRTGEIKAISNMQRIRSGAYAEIKNHGVADELEPGSTFKVAAMIVALEDKVCSPDEIVDTGNGIYPYSGRRIVDHNANKGGYHQITVAQSIWYSSNIGVAKMILRGYERDPKKFTDGLKRIGADADLGIEIPGAGKAKIRTPESRLWSRTTLPWMSFGYEVQIPPIHTLAFFNAIANKGKMVRPIFMKEIQQDGKTIERQSTEVIRNSICSDETLEIIHEMLINVVKKGTGTPIYSEAVSIAGKTGTAQIATGGGYQSHQVSFCGYFPAEKPQYSCIVVIRRPRIGYPSGGTMSGGVFKTIAEKVYSSQVKIDLRSSEPDSGKVNIPLVKDGNVEALTYVLDEFNLKFKPKKFDFEYTIADRDQQEQLIQVNRLTVIENLVPRVVGMGAKDAVYALEKSGLKVSLTGKGQVISQSIQPGVRIVKGQTISIVLKD